MTEITKSFDDRRDIVVAGNKDATIRFAVDNWIHSAHEAIADHGYFAVALSGGSTPKAIYQLLSSEAYRNKVDWAKVRLYFSDERCVPPTDPESNYKMAIDSGIGTLPIKPENIYRMVGEGDPELNGQAYDALIKDTLPDVKFDLVMLGMGDDGHTASLFPKTHGLHAENREAIANYIPKFQKWRLSLTFDCINRAKKAVIYVIGKNKAESVKEIFTSAYNPDHLPIQKVGTRKHKALWVLDEGAGSLLN